MEDEKAGDALVSGFGPGAANPYEETKKCVLSWWRRLVSKTRESSGSTCPSTSLKMHSYLPPIMLFCLFPLRTSPSNVPYYFVIYRLFHHFKTRPRIAIRGSVRWSFSPAVSPSVLPHRLWLFNLVDVFWVIWYFCPLNELLQNGYRMISGRMKMWMLFFCQKRKCISFYLRDKAPSETTTDGKTVAVIALIVVVNRNYLLPLLWIIIKADKERINQRCLLLRTMTRTA